MSSDKSSHHSYVDDTAKSIDEKMSGKKVDETEQVDDSSMSSHSCFRHSRNTSSSKDANQDNYSSAASRVFGGRFSKSPEERVRILNQRKDDLMRLARQSFVLKQRQQEDDKTN